VRNNLGSAPDEGGQNPPDLKETPPVNGSLKMRTALDYPSVPASRYLETPLHALIRCG